MPSHRGMIGAHEMSAVRTGQSSDPAVLWRVIGRRERMRRHRHVQSNALVIDAFVEELKQAYTATYTTLEPDYPGIIAYVGHMALELIANSDAPYHDLSHTVCVTLVGQEVIRGKHLRQGGVSPRDWLHFIISLLCHDIGYVRGICGHVGSVRYAINANGDTIVQPKGATDATLTP